MLAQRFAALIELDRLLKIDLAAFKLGHNVFQRRQRLFERRAV